jgi:hypothetical protein
MKELTADCGISCWMIFFEKADFPLIRFRVAAKYDPSLIEEEVEEFVSL